jgi:hypothetical protein
MSYILSAQRDVDPPESSENWERYQAYLRENKSRFPVGAYALATSDWYFDFSDHRAPHDAWLESATFQEQASGSRSEIRSLSFRIRLLGAYHDNWIELYYPKVYRYSFESGPSKKGHGDWRYDEFRLSEKGALVHEIEWAGSVGGAARWLIEASDIVFSVEPRVEV